MKHFKIGLVLITLAVMGNALQGAIPSSERQALIALYNATGGDSWTNKSGWKNGTLDPDGFAAAGTENTWYGVYTNTGNTTVTNLGLWSNNLVGTLPASLGNLTGLTLLDLNNNQLSGSIPVELGNLAGLQDLRLNDNHLSGSIPVELGDLTNLVNLFLYHNQLSGLIPAELGNSSSLIDLNLSGNQLSGSIPANLRNLVNLRLLNLALNPLSGSIPAELGNLASLQELRLDYAGLSGSIPPELGDLANLLWLSLPGNQLSGSIPPELGDLTHLQGLDLSSNPLSGSIPPELGNLASLQWLYLSSTQLNGLIPLELGKLANLNWLSLQDNRLSGSIPAELGNLANCGMLRLDFNQLSGSIPPELGGLHQLGGLYLTSNHLSGPIPPELGSMSSLSVLKIGINQLSGSIPAELDNLANLYYLELNYNQLSGSIPADLGNLTNLRGLDLGSNKLSGSIPAELCSLTNLTSLILGYNSLTATNPDLLAFLSLKSPGWASTQTITPTGLTATAAGGTTILVSWTPILYAGDAGGYIVSMSTTSGGPYTVVDQTATKSVSSMTVSGLTPGQPYYFVVRTHTDAHAQNTNVLESEDSAPVAAATFAQLLVTGTVLAGGSPLPNVVMSGLTGDPVTNASGVYQGLVSIGWTGTVTPTLANYTFDPSSRTYTNVTSDITAQNYAASLITTPQRQALIALYNSTNGDSWANSAGWKTEPLYPDGFAMPGTEGTWFGVTVDSGTQAVTVILLSDNNLTGTIPAALGSLTGLMHLVLQHNSLSGSIPAELGQLEFLQTLNFYDNRLTGSIPAELGSLLNLRYLYLNSNQLSGPIPPELGNLTNLESIVLRYNQLSGTIPTQLGNLTNLQYLRLGYNQLSGEIPAELGNLTNLLSLRLLENHLSGAIPATLGNLTNLTDLLLNSNKLTGPIPTSLTSLTALGSSSTDLGYNALYTSDDTLITFLNSKDADWAATQTIAPSDVTATALDNAIVLVSWLPVTYTADAGYYKIYISQIAGGPYTLAGETENKTTSAVNVTGLTPGQRYYFVVHTQTKIHANNANAVESDDSTEASAVAWLQTQVRVAGTVTLGGSPLQGVVMDGLPGNPATNSSGVYDVTLGAGWSGTVTPTLAGYTFAPASTTYTSVTVDQLTQNYTATAILPTITVTSPNGGETWAAGSTHAITWTQTGLTGSVTIDLYKGGVFQKPLGTAGATAGTFSWTIVSTEIAGIDYRVLVWQSGVSDESDADFSIFRRLKADFNKDGQEDILWRCYGTGEFQGWNVVWFMNQTGALSPVTLGGTQNTAGARNLPTGSTPTKTYLSPMDVGNPQTAGPERAYLSPMDVGNPLAPKQKKLTRGAVDLGRKSSRETSVQTRGRDLKGNPVLQDAEKLVDGSFGTLALDYSDANLYTVLDTAWEIAGAGDFDGDGNTDILWRYYGTGQGQGTTIIWYMTGTTISRQGYPYQVTDTDWRIDRTGDFNGDGKTDILWRYYGSAGGQGTAIIWCMDGANVIDQLYLPWVSDTDWKIDGIGDFNGDGKADLLWRYYRIGEGQGTTIIWYMDGATIMSQDRPYLISDTDWRIDGTGDFDGDGKTDILWRYYGAGEGSGTTFIWYMDGATIKGQDRPYRVPDTNWRIVNR